MYYDVYTFYEKALYAYIVDLMDTFEIPRALMRENTVMAKVYFLLLQKPRTVTELSRILYCNKIQLNRIGDAKKILEKHGAIVRVNPKIYELEKRGEDVRLQYWKATYKPFIEYCKMKLKERPSRYKDKKGEPVKRELSEEDIKVLELMFNSKWFNNFLTGEYVKYELGREGKLVWELLEEKRIRDDEDEELTTALWPYELRDRSEQLGEYNGGAIIFPDPLKSLSYLLEELCAIRMTYSFYRGILHDLSGIKTTNEEIIKAGNWDKFIEQKSALLNEDAKATIRNILKIGKKNLGEDMYESVRVQFDIMFGNYGLLFIPLELADKLQTVGRVPLTVFLCFENAVEHIEYNEKKETRKLLKSFKKTKT
jgi:hypothetical protein